MRKQFPLPFTPKADNRSSNSRYKKDNSHDSSAILPPQMNAGQGGGRSTDRKRKAGDEKPIDAQSRHPSDNGKNDNRFKRQRLSIEEKAKAHYLSENENFTNKLKRLRQLSVWIKKILEKQRQHELVLRKEIWRQETEEIFSYFQNMLINKQQDFEDCANQVAIDDLGFFVYNLGFLARHLESPNLLSASFGTSLLNFIYKKQEKNFEATANMLVGLYNWAKVKKTFFSQENALSEAVIKAINYLATLKSIRAITISKSLNAIGYFAKSKLLTTAFDSDLLMRVLKNLLNSNELDSQSVANSLTGLGHIAREGLLINFPDVDLLIVALKKLFTLNPIHEEISNSIDSFSNLALAKLLQKPIDSNLVMEGLNKFLSSKRYELQSLVTCMNAIGFLGRAKALTSPIDSSLFTKALEKILILNPNCQSISIGVKVFANLGLSDLLTTPINSTLFTNALTRLLTIDSDVQSLCNSLNAIGHLGRIGLLTSPFKSQLLMAILRKQLSLNSNAQDIAVSMSSCHNLSAKRLIKGSFSYSFLNDILMYFAKLTKSDQQNISMFLYSLGLLYKVENLSQPLHLRSLQTIMTNYYRFKTTHEMNIRCLISLNFLLKNQKGEGLHLFAGILENTLEFNQELHLTLILQSISSLVNYKSTASASDMVVLNNLFKRVLDKTNPLPYTILPEQQQQQLKVLIDNRFQTGDPWQKRLINYFGFETADTPALDIEAEDERMEVEEEEVESMDVDNQPQPTSRRPRPSRDKGKEKEKTSTQQKPMKISASSKTSKAAWEQDPIYKALTQRNIGALRALLNLCGKKLATVPQKNKSAGFYESSGRRSVSISPSCAYLVQDFFTQVPRNVLGELTKTMDLESCTLLFQACSAHERYELCCSTLLYPLWQNLPLNTLKALITLLISPFTIYRDHKALIYLIDALTIRQASYPSESASIQILQKNLLREAISFHDLCKHSHVSRRLKQVERQIMKKQLVLLEEDLLESPSNERQEELPRIPPKETPRLVKPDLNYFYESEDIDAILNALIDLMHQNQRVVCLSAVQMESELAAARIGETVSSWKQYAGLTQDSRIQTIVPINIANTHWIGVLLKWEGETITDIFFFDSLASSIEDHADYYIKIISDLKKAELISSTQSMQNKTLCYQPQGSVGCGPFLIENIYYFIKGTVPQQLSELGIRQRQLQILKDKNPNAYASLSRKQHRPTAILSLEEQEKLHGAGTEEPSAQNKNGKAPVSSSRRLPTEPRNIPKVLIPADKPQAVAVQKIPVVECRSVREEESCYPSFFKPPRRQREETANQGKQIEKTNNGPKEKY